MNFSRLRLETWISPVSGSRLEFFPSQARDLDFSRTDTLIEAAESRKLKARTASETIDDGVEKSEKEKSGKIIVVANFGVVEGVLLAQI